MSKDGDGTNLMHDVFGECTLVFADDSLATGSFKVKVLSDGSERELTRGHFGFVTKSIDEDEGNPAVRAVGGDKGGESVGHEAGMAQSTENSAGVIAGEAVDAADVPVEEDIVEASTADEVNDRVQAGSAADAAAPVATDAEADTTQEASTEHANAHAAADCTPIYEATIAAASKHVVEFNLDPEDLELNLML
eukprot:6196864-Pleurochrysis_carterae.AAC.1